MNIAQNIENGRRLFPEAPALTFEGTTYSYADLDDRASRCAAALRRLGVERGDRVALYLPNIPAFAFAYYGAMKLGAIAVSINGRATREDVAFVLADCGAKIVVTVADLRANVPDGEVASVEHVLIAEGPAGTDSDLDALIDAAAPGTRAATMGRDEPAAILYTSGTTGFPKGATLSHGNVISNMWSFVHNCGMRPGDRILLHLPLFHCFGQNALLNSALLAGASLVLHRGFRPDAVLEAVEQDAITMFFGVPTMFLALLDRATPEAFRSVRYYFSAAAALPREVERRWTEKFGRPITQGYGLTETSPFASYNHFLQHRPGSIGVPIENVEMKIVDVETGQDAEVGALGEIIIRGPNVMLGYWNRPDATAQAIDADGWFHSGDIGRMDADGYFTIEDRLKDMIDVGGMNVYPVEVENVLYRHGAVAEAAVFGVPDALMGEQVWAHLVLKPGATATEAEIGALCRTHLADYKVPRVVAFVEELPKNPTGKLLKRVLREQAKEAAAAAPPAEAPLAAAFFDRPETERLDFLKGHLRREIATALEMEPGMIDDDEPLVDLGLESMAAVDLGVGLREQLGVDVSAIALVGGGSLADLAAELARALDARREPVTT